MKSVLATVIGFAVSFAAFATQSGASPSTGSDALQRDVVQFYEDVNFVASFSTPTERAAILATRLSHQRLEREAGPSRRGSAPLAEPLSARQQDVERRLTRIVVHTLPIEDGMPLHFGVQDAVPPAELFRAVGQDKSGETLRVRVEAWPITYEHNLRLAADYDGLGRRDAEPVPPQESRARRPRLELHRWRLVSDKWMRLEGAIMHVQRSPR